MRDYSGQVARWITSLGGAYAGKPWHFAQLFFGLVVRAPARTEYAALLEESNWAPDTAAPVPILLITS